MLINLPKRFQTKIKVINDGRRLSSCWKWTGALDRKGYGRVNWNGHARRAHRIIYELLIGKIPDNLPLDHLCRVPGCVRPSHCEPVTTKENNRRSPNGGWGGIQRRKTHCPQGHPYDEANTTKLKKGGRSCRTCAREKAKNNPYSSREWQCPKCDRTGLYKDRNRHMKSCNLTTALRGTPDG